MDLNGTIIYEANKKVHKKLLNKLVQHKKVLKGFFSF